MPWLAIVVLLVAACWGTSGSTPVASTPAPEPVQPGTIRFRAKTRSDCARVLAGTGERIRAELARVGTTEPILDEMQAVAIESCEQTVWSDDVLACYAKVAVVNDIATCTPLMTREQRDDISSRMMGIAARMNTAPPPSSP
ncbi:MAG: hypothetical protein H0T89_15055 [Deltaproteobacteria bacterium]|nr:hypothetical protein [Deltaproteobacteria bacterium]MDQ3295120.1 hypothetical protein [Myxococcota bacterium]